MALDEPSNLDKVEELNGIRFVVANELYEEYKGFTIESVKRDDQMLFRITPDIQNSSSCGGCTSCS
jgi:hypothetical protein